MTEIALYQPDSADCGGALAKRASRVQTEADAYLLARFSLSSGAYARQRRAKPPRARRLPGDEPGAHAIRQAIVAGSPATASSRPEN